MTDSLVQDAPGKSGAAVREPASASEASRMLEEVRALGPELRSRAAEVEAQSRVSDEMIRALHKIGVFKMTVPVEYGGYAFTPSQIVPVYAEITRACGSTGWVAWVTTTGTQWMTSYSHKLQEEMFLAGWEGPYQSGAMNKGGPGEGRRVEGGQLLIDFESNLMRLQVAMEEVNGDHARKAIGRRYVRSDACGGYMKEIAARKIMKIRRQYGRHSDLNILTLLLLLALLLVFFRSFFPRPSAGSPRARGGRVSSSTTVA